jgi:hypothetical protein
MNRTMATMNSIIPITIEIATLRFMTIISPVVVELEHL